MKTKIFYILAIISLYGIEKVKAQDYQFGVIVEPQICWFTVVGDNSESIDNDFGYSFGLTADNFFYENYAITSGITLNTVNSTLSFYENIEWLLNNKPKQIDEGFPVNLTIQYVDIPLGMKFVSRDIGYLKIYASLGAKMMLRVKALAEIPDANIYKNSAKDEVALFNMGYFIGGGIEYSLGGNTSIVAGVNFNNGLIDLTENHADDVNFSTFAFRLGINF